MKTLIKKGLLKATFKSEYVWTRIADRLREETKNETDADPLKVLWISPESIRFVTGETTKGHTQNPFHRGHFKEFRNPGVSNIGSVIDGNWDLSRTRFDELPIYLGLRERYEDGIELKDTAYYRYWINHLKTVSRKSDHLIEKKALEKCKKYEKLLSSIDRNGYQTQRQQLKTSLHEEIAVNIGRDGDLLFTGGGRHRLSVAKILKLESVPVIVKVRHKNWQQIRNEIGTCRLEDVSEKARNKLGHPDLQDVQTGKSSGLQSSPKQARGARQPFART